MNMIVSDTKPKYVISVSFHKNVEYVYTDNYILVYEIFRNLCEVYPSDAVIDILDNNTGEVFESNNW